MSHPGRWLTLGLVLLAFVAMPLRAQHLDPDPYDRSEAQYCSVCHSVAEQTQIQTFIYNDWINTYHANSWQEHNGNTYCMNCHAPFQADPDATHDENVPVPIEESQAITCTVCHPNHYVREALGTPIGNYIVGSIDEPNDQGVLDSDDNPVMGSWIPVMEDDAGDLCTYCHEGRHEKKLNYMKSFECTDCHMPEVDLTIDTTDDQGNPTTEVVQVRSHNFEFPVDDDDALAEKAEAACVGCHDAIGLGFFDGGTSVEDAVAAIRSGLIHNDKPAADAGGPYAGFVGRTLTVDASASTDPEDDDMMFSWDFGDGSDPTEPSPDPTASHVYAEVGQYTAKVTVVDTADNASTASADVDIQMPVTDDWQVRLPFSNEAFDMTLEPFAGVLIVYMTDDGGMTIGVGLEMDGIIMWMNPLGDLFFGSADRDAGTMQGILFGGQHGSAIWFGERL